MAWNRPNRASHGHASLLRSVAMLIALAVMAMIFYRGQQGPTIPISPAPALPSAPPAPPTVAAPVRNPIEQMLRPAAGMERRPGTAAAIVVDTSGSMQSPVADVGGARRPKIELARRAVLNLVEQASRFAAEHPDRPLMLGVYEFSSRDRHDNCRPVVALGKPNVEATRQALVRLHPTGGTPIGDAMIRAKRDLNATGFSRQHILVVTDGDNTQGYTPGDVAAANSRLPDDQQAAIYLIAFDTAAAKFEPVKNAGGLVLPAASATELNQTLDYILTGRILAEQPSAPAAAQP